ncbi:ABC transporter permease [Conexibacter stalactiti]|uniref:ABC transporter permease n=1 Tax=Conexibacter stalactiti TaxID=1940611 RepID=A0ABU4HYM2_9ACTN|nr:ABC transporter permease [Conexibacter stalactiti]MDW5598428.1 ABC transporter permease [Conexibacter stalactiti]MEC5039070.1 ABC transporter permease [Conexibacter stalactiti]
MRSVRRVTATMVRTPTGALALAGVALLVGLAIFAPLLWGDQADRLDVTAAGQGPSAEHWLGTDELGRDILLRTLVATRLALLLDLAAVGSAAVIGIALGVAIGFGARWLRSAATTAIDTCLSFGDVLLAIVVLAVVGVGTRGTVIAVALSFVATFARMAMTMTRGVLVQEYVAAARVVGVPRRRLATRYLLPNVAEGLTVFLCTSLGSGLLAISALSFLGLGVQPPQYDWGQMLTEGTRQFYTNPAAALAPAAMIGFAGLTLSLLGDALARAANPLVWTASRSARRGRRARRAHALETAA